MSRRVAVPGDRAPKSWRQFAEASLERVVEGVAVALGQVQQADEAGLTLDERADGGLLVLADDEIDLPVAGLGSVVGWERPLVDREHRFEPRAASIAALLGAAVLPSGAQR